MTAPTNRRCRRCGATQGLRIADLDPLSATYARVWECRDGCPPGARQPVDLDTLDVLDVEATAGPWTTGDDGLVWSSLVTGPVATTTYAEDARLIAAARTALPELVTELREARREVERLRAERDELASRVAPLRQIAEEAAALIAGCTCDHPGDAYIPHRPWCATQHCPELCEPADIYTPVPDDPRWQQAVRAAQAVIYGGPGMGGDAVVFTALAAALRVLLAERPDTPTEEDTTVRTHQTLMVRVARQLVAQTGWHTDCTELMADGGTVTVLAHRSGARIEARTTRDGDLAEVCLVGLDAATIADLARAIARGGSQA